MDEHFGPPAPTEPKLAKVTIPAQPELVMTGVTGLLQPSIMKCAMGGWMVVIPGKGVASKSTLDEAIAFLEDYAFEFFGEPKTVPIPEFMHKPREEAPATEEDYAKWRGRLSKSVNMIMGAIVLFAGVKLAI